MPNRLLVTLSAAVLAGACAAQAFAQTAARGPATFPPDILDRLKIPRTTLNDVAKILGLPRSNKDGLAEYTAGGYVLRLLVSTDPQTSGHPPGTVLGAIVEMEKPRRVREPQPLLLNGYWTPKVCDDAGACAFDLGSFNPMHVAKLKDLGLEKRCAPVLREDVSAIRYTCAGGKANNSIDVEVQADLKLGLEGDLAMRGERARLVMKIRTLENDPNNPDRNGAKTMRQQYGIVGAITNETVWALVKDLPITAYGVFTTLPPTGAGGPDDRFRTSLANG